MVLCEELRETLHELKLFSNIEGGVVISNQGKLIESDLDEDRTNVAVAALRQMMETMRSETGAPSTLPDGTEMCLDDLVHMKIFDAKQRALLAVLLPENYVHDTDHHRYHCQRIADRVGLIMEIRQIAAQRSFDI
ncbi:MAG: hypothetical protein U9N13_05205 [Euryarchaeota archaeon]|nr:hypothetical protein [Euryarchaeota archaeon]